MRAIHMGNPPAGLSLPCPDSNRSASHRAGPYSRMLYGSEAAVYGNLGAGHVLGLVGSQVNDGIGDVIRLADMAYQGEIVQVLPVDPRLLRVLGRRFPLWLSGCTPGGPN